MTPDLLRKLEELRAAAPGDDWDCSWEAGGRRSVVKNSLGPRDRRVVFLGGTDPDRHLIVAAVNALPELIAAAKAKERYEKALRRIVDHTELGGAWAVANAELALGLRAEEE